jgi:hypothetical protein
MVKALHKFTAAALLLLCATGNGALAEVVASVDRADVELNESFTLDVTVDTAINAEPDVSVLEKDFLVVSQSSLSNTTIINGEISRSRTWSYVLMAKQAGKFVIPPITVGRERSNTLEISIAPVRAVMPGKSDIFVVAEADYDETYVQAQVLYTIKVYRAVATRQPSLSEPAIRGDVLVELAADEKSYDSLIDGKSYNVVERVYALFPQASGKISIEPALFEARVLRDGRITGRKIFKSEPVTVEVKPIPPPPAAFPDAAWFPAKSVELAEEWSREPETLPAGEPITRRITVTALGQLSTQIPVIEPVESDGIKVYPDKPELNVRAVPEGMLATRKDQYALIGVDPGAVSLPELSLPWWNIEEDRWEIATLPPKMVNILPSADDMPKPSIASQPVQHDEPAGNTLVVHSKTWRYVSEALAGLWVLTVLAWWWSRRESARPPSQEQSPPQKQQAGLVKEARQAALRSDAGAVKAALLRWGRLQWPENAPRSVGDIALRVPEPLAAELKALSKSSYGPGEGPWNGAGLAAALRSFKPAREGSAADGEALPPLMPQA